MYEHFRDKQEILIELAIEGQVVLAREILIDLPADPYRALLSMVERYWSFMLEHTLPFGKGKTSPVAAEDVARVVATLLADPQPHIAVRSEEALRQSPVSKVSLIRT